MIVFTTGDPLVDFWEYQVSLGMVPDLSLCEDEKSKKRDALMSSLAKEHKERTGELIYIAEDVKRTIDAMDENGWIPIEFLDTV